MITESGEVFCDGMPSMMGCAERIKPTRKWTKEGRKKTGWLVDHATEDIWGTPSKPIYLLHFCPSCAEIVLRQIAKQERKP